RLHLTPLPSASCEQRTKPCARLLGALGISACNAADGGGGRLSEPLLQRLLVLDVRLLAEPLIDGLIQQLGHRALSLACDFFKSSLSFALHAPAVDLGFHALHCNTGYSPRQERALKIGMPFGQRVQHGVRSLSFRAHQFAFGAFEIGALPVRGQAPPGSTDRGSSRA